MLLFMEIYITVVFVKPRIDASRFKLFIEFAMDIIFLICIILMVSCGGIEPPTFCLKGKHSTAELTGQLFFSN